MYQKKYDSICDVGPAFEELSENDIRLVDGGAASAGLAAIAEATKAFCAFTYISCFVSATVASCVVTGAYVIKKK